MLPEPRWAGHQSLRLKIKPQPTEHLKNSEETGQDEAGLEILDGRAHAHSIGTMRAEL
jgi:hypothetical protein